MSNLLAGWFESDEIEVPEEHDAQELLYDYACSECDGDMTHHDYKAYGVCKICADNT